MRKYYIIFKNSIQANLAYRFNTFAFLFAEAFSFVIMFYLFFSIYAQGQKMGNYSLTNLVAYFALTKLITVTLLYDNFGFTVRDEIMEGRIVEYLVKPIGYMAKSFALKMGNIIFRLLPFIIIIAPLYFFFSLSVNLAEIFYFSAFFLIGSLISFFVFYIVGIASFFIGEIVGFNFLFLNIIYFFSGGAIPIDLFPENIRAIINFFPFKLIGFVPVSIITGNYDLSSAPRDILSGIVWILIFYGLAKILFASGIRRLEAYGS
ncbi:MAG: ABC-2 family transporter protein [Patescibacteria group bacterium]|jgi:ABC-2 type transport system permease protein